MQAVLTNGVPHKTELVVSESYANKQKSPQYLGEIGKKKRKEGDKIYQESKVKEKAEEEK
jgi:hypothetical protein